MDSAGPVSVVIVTEARFRGGLWRAPFITAGIDSAREVRTDTVGAVTWGSRLTTVSVVVALVGVVALFGMLGMPATSASAQAATFGAYEWNTSTWWPNASQYGPTLVRLRALGVNTLYVDITEAVTLTQDDSSQLGSFLSDFSDLVTEADAGGFHVVAVGGEAQWATTSPGGPAELLAAVARVTQSLPAGALEGVQFDVEPWAIKALRRHAATYALDWLQFVQTTVSAWRSDALTGSLGFTVPYWFNGDSSVPQVTFASETGYPFQLALGLVASLPQTNFNVMAYRNTTSGVNGSEALFNANLQLVAAGSHTTLLLGQETGRVKPRSITFYRKGCADFDNAVSQIGATFGANAHYGGIPVDDVETLLALCPST